MSTKIELNKIVKLFTIFNQKKWVDIDGFDENISRFGELIDNLKSEQVELLITLTERYRWYSYNEYHSQLRSLLKSLYAQHLEGIDKIYLFPIIKPKDEENTKSGHAIMYFLDSIKPSLPQYEKIEFELLKKFEDLEPENLKLEENEILLLVDDYVGSGGTLNASLSELEKNKSLNERFIILTVMIQESTKETLDGNNIINVVGEITNKGISDHYEGDELKKNIELMEQMEKTIPKVKNYKFGYESSEALVTMIKTPNNTFPIFWKDYHRKGKTYKAPFARH